VAVRYTVVSTGQGGCLCVYMGSNVSERRDEFEPTGDAPRQRPASLFSLPAYGNRAHGGSQIAISPINPPADPASPMCFLSASGNSPVLLPPSPALNLPAPFPAFQFGPSAHLPPLEARGKCTDTENNRAATGNGRAGGVGCRAPTPHNAKQMKGDEPHGHHGPGSACLIVQFTAYGHRS